MADSPTHLHSSQTRVSSCSRTCVRCKTALVSDSREAYNLENRSSTVSPRIHIILFSPPSYFRPRPLPESDPETTPAFHLQCKTSV